MCKSQPDFTVKFHRFSAVSFHRCIEPESIDFFSIPPALDIAAVAYPQRLGLPTVPANPQRVLKPGGHFFYGPHAGG